MKLTLDADVAPDVVQNAWSLFCLASVDERPLNDLEMLGWLAQRCRTSVRHIRRMTHNLQRMGELYIVPAIGRRNSNLYLMTIGRSADQLHAIMMQRLNMSSEDADRAVATIGYYAERAARQAEIAALEKEDTQVLFYSENRTPRSGKEDLGVLLTVKNQLIFNNTYHESDDQSDRRYAELIRQQIAVMLHANAIMCHANLTVHGAQICIASPVPADVAWLDLRLRSNIEQICQRIIGQPITLIIMQIAAGTGGNHSAKPPADELGRSIGESARSLAAFEQNRQLP